MLLLDIEQDVIKPLSRREKLQLIADITQMLQEEDELSRYFQPGVVYEVATPNLTPDDSAMLAAQQLQKVLEGLSV